VIRVTPAEGSYVLAAEAIEVFYGRPVTRQQVYAWWVRRGNNGFPEHVNYDKFDLATVVRWYGQYRPTVGRPRGGDEETAVCEVPEAPEGTES
jgi:hypothetical protein